MPSCSGRNRSEIRVHPWVSWLRCHSASRGQGWDTTLKSDFKDNTLLVYQGIALVAVTVF